ncbi:HAD family hydrolase [Enterococcus faecalis]|nr:HAD family hydrolase [Enterococcus faecalis]
MENRGILFDKDGTCIRFDTLWQAGLQACFETLSMLAPHHSAEIKKILAIQEQRFLQKHLHDEVLYQELYQELAQFEELVEQGISSRWLEQFFYDYLRKNLKKIEPIGDLKQLFLELKRKNYKIGLATSDTLPATMLIMEYLGLTEMFDFIATGDRYLPKPDADMLQAFCQSCQLKLTEVIMVGDSLVDVFMGTCHGKAGIGVLTGNCQSTDFENFEVAYFRDIHEIPYQELWGNTKKKKILKR